MANHRVLVKFVGLTWLGIVDPTTLCSILLCCCCCCFVVSLLLSLDIFKSTKKYSFQIKFIVNLPYSRSAIMDIIVWDFLKLYHIFFSPQVKRSLIVSNKHNIYELPRELPNDFLRLNLVPSPPKPKAPWTPTESRRKIKAAPPNTLRPWLHHEPPNMHQQPAPIGQSSVHPTRKPSSPGEKCKWKTLFHGEKCKNFKKLRIWKKHKPVAEKQSETEKQLD